MEQQHTTEADAGAALAAAAFSPRMVNGTPYLILPEGYVAKDLEATLPAPTRQRSTHTAADRDGFLALWDRFHDEKSVIFADVETATFTAVFDFPSLGQPAWAAHRATYKPRPSIDWHAWNGSNGRKMAQVDFAEFVENNLAAIVRPTPAQMLEVSTHLVAHREVKFESATRLANGQNQFRYDEQIRGQVAHSSIDVPERFVLGLSPFFKGELFELEARLRYRINEGKLVMWYDLDRPSEFFQKAALKLAADIASAAGTTVIFGSP